MKISLISLLLFLLFINNLKSQDIIFKNNGDTIFGSLYKEDSTRVYFSAIIKKKIINTAINKAEIKSFYSGSTEKQMILDKFLKLESNYIIICRINKSDSTNLFLSYFKDRTIRDTIVSREEIISKNTDVILKSKIESNIDKFTVGVGFGLEYGFIGPNFSIYPIPYIGIWGGIGYAFNDSHPGYNVGVKFRCITNNQMWYITPYALAMYGSNASVILKNESELNKIFYGPSIGFGFDIRESLNQKLGYLSISLIIPFRSSGFDQYINNFESQNYKFNITDAYLSIGYKVIIK
jgi:hypothetical protein